MSRSILVALIMSSLISVHSSVAGEPNQIPLSHRPTRPVHTYSIVARDPKTGDIGVAVQSHWFAVGPLVPWAEAGVGAVATQSFVDPSYGKLGLDLMRAGRSGPEALKGLLAADENREVRQVADPKALIPASVLPPVREAVGVLPVRVEADDPGLWSKLRHPRGGNAARGSNLKEVAARRDAACEEVQFAGRH